MPAPPPIDRRSFDDLVTQTERLLQRYSDWQRLPPVPALLIGRVLRQDVADPTTGQPIAAEGTLVDESLAQRISQAAGLDRVSVLPLPDAGSALVRVFAHLAELVLDRLNQVPEKNLLAFLDLAGLDLLPPQAARVPLTFQLAPGSTVDALVPARTPVAAAPVEGEAAPVVFETERQLVVTRSQLVAVRSREPGRDRHGDNTATATGTADAAFPAFEGDQPIDHRIYLGHHLFGIDAAKTITLRFGPADGPEPWPAAVTWSGWDGTAWNGLAATVAPTPVDSGWEVTLRNVPAIPETTIGGQASAWLRGQLVTPLPRHELIDTDPGIARRELRLPATPPDAGFSDGAPLDFDQTVFPFGRLTPRSACYLAGDDAFGKPGAQVTIEVDVDVDAGRPAKPSPDLLLAWEFWDGNQWRELGRSSPSGSPIASLYGLDDGSSAFTRDGVVEFRCPAGWAAATVNGVTHLWLRVRITAGRYGSPADYRPPAVARLALRYAWPLPRIESVRARIAIKDGGLRPDTAFANQVPIDPTSELLPFGDKPRFNDTLYLASDKAFGAPTAMVTLDITVTNQRRPQAVWPVPPVKASPDLTLAWEYWTGTQWALLGTATPLPADRVLEPVPSPFEGDTLTLTGERPEMRTVTVREVHTGTSTPTVDQDGRTWKATVTDLSPGMHAFQVTVTDGQPVQRLWAAAFCAPPDAAAPTPLWLAPVPGITGAPSLTIRGKAPVANGRVLIHEATAAAAVETAFSQEFEVTVGLQEGRNDLLVLVFDNAGRAVAGDVVSVVRRAATVASDFQDSTWALTRSGQVGFRLPADATPREVNGQAGSWLRTRIVAGDYGVDARYDPVINPDTGEVVVDPNTGAPIYQLVPATFRPPSLGPIALGYDYVSALVPPDHTLTENDFEVHDRSEAVASGAGFEPFVTTSDEQPTLYLGFQRPEAVTGFAGSSMALYLGVAEVRYGRSDGQQRSSAEPPGVVWEYWNGSRWAHLGTHDQTQGLTRRGLVTFIGPEDFRSSTEFGQTAFWLRARWERGAYASPPRLRRVLTNTMWASHTHTVSNEILGSSNGEPNQVFRTAAAPVLSGQRIEVREPELPSATERTTLEAEEGSDAATTILDAAGRPVEIWVRWHHTGDFHESTSRSRHYTLDRLTGEIRFGDDRRGMAPPQGRANVRAAWYQAGGGPQGNRPAGAITQLKSAVPYVDAVTNWEASSGGSTQETLEAVKARGPRVLRHRDRAVAISDFEDLALEATTDVAHVRAIPARGPEEMGRVVVMVVPRLAGPQPIPDLELLGRVADHIRQRLSPTVELRVEGPDWLRVEVAAEIVPVSLDAATDVQAAVLARLSAFLHPLTGGLDGQGWNFGRQPYRSDLYALIEHVPGVDHVRRLTVTTEADDGVARPDRFLVYSGDHQITMAGEPGAEDGTAAP
jgi:predicted phage baseplate assembly protein